MPDLAMIPQYAEILTALQAAWNTVQTEKTMRIVLIEGASGMKKSELVRRFLHECPANSLIGRGLNIPELYWPLRQAYESTLDLKIIRKHLRKSRKRLPRPWQLAFTTLAQAIQFIPLSDNPFWKNLVRWQLNPFYIDEEELERSTPISFPELFTFALGDLTRILPVILFLQNLDEADDSTLKSLISTVLPSLKTHPLLFIADFENTPSQKQSLVAEFVETAKNTVDTLHFTLDPLPENEIRDIITKELPTVMADLSKEEQRAVQQRIQTITEGNIARLTDLIYWISHTPPQNRQATLESLSDFTSILYTLFLRLSKEEQEFLQMAATQGYYFCLAVVAHALSKEENELAHLLARMSGESGTWIRWNVTVRHGERSLQWYEFLGKERYQLVRNSLPEHQRSDAHHKIARALETIYHEALSSISGLLASQFEQAHRKISAADYQLILAHQANNQGELSRAFEYAQKGLHNLESIEKPEETREFKILRCQLLLEKGRAMQGTEQATAALDVLRNAYALARDLYDLNLEIDTGQSLGRILLDRNLWNEGIGIIERSLELARNQQNWRSIVEAMEILRSRYHRRGEDQGYLVLCDTIIADLSEYESDQHLLVITEILEDKGWIYLQRNENENALQTFEQALSFLHQLKDPKSYPEIFYKIYRWLTIVSRSLKNYETSLKQSEEAIRWADASLNLRKQVFARYEKAKTLQWLARIQDADHEMESALQLVKHSSDLITRGAFEEDYGFFFSKTGRKQRSREMYQYAYEHYTAAHNFQNAQEVRGHLATIDKNSGFFNQALATYQSLAYEAMSFDDKSSQGLALNHIGDIYRIQNQLNKAEQTHLKVLQLCRETHDISRKAITLRYLGQAYLVQLAFSQANTSLTEADSEQNQAGYNEIWNYRVNIFSGRLALCEGKKHQAQEQIAGAIEKLEAIQDSLWVGLAKLNYVLALLSAGNSQDAILLAEEVLEVFQNLESWRLSEAYHLLARCYLALGDVEQAQAEIEQAQSLFMKLKLFHRVHQAENTEIKIEEARRNKKKLGNYRLLRLDELRQDFNHLGI